MEDSLSDAERAARRVAGPRWLIPLLIGGVIGFVTPLAISPGSDFGQALADPLAPLVGLLWIFPLLIMIHEGGHLLAGWLVEFSFHRCYIGPLKISRARQGLRLQLSKEHLFSGAVLCSPTDDYHLRRRIAIFSAGGPLANLLLAAVAWRLWFFYHALCCADATTQPPVMVDSLALLALLSVETAIINSLPFHTRRYASDGLHICRMLRGGRSCEREMVATQLVGYMLGGVRPRDWPSDLVLRRIVLAEKPSEEHSACVAAYSWALDTGDIPGAGAFLDRALATLPTPSKPHPVLALETAYFEARYRFNLAAARAWLKYGKGSEFEPALRPRVEMAILLAEGRYEEALLRAAQGLAACALLAPRTLSGLDTEEESLRAMAAEAQAAIAGVPV